MDKKELLNKLKNIQSVVDFYAYKTEIIRQLEQDLGVKKEAKKKVKKGD